MTDIVTFALEQVFDRQYNCDVCKDILLWS